LGQEKLIWSDKTRNGGKDFGISKDNDLEMHGKGTVLMEFV